MGTQRFRALVAAGPPTCSRPGSSSGRDRERVVSQLRRARHRTGLACKGGRPNGRGLGCGGCLPGVSRGVLRAGRAQFGPFRRHPGLPDGRRRRAARRGSLPAQTGRAAVYLSAIRGGRAHRACRRPVRCGRGVADRGERGRPAGDALPGTAAIPVRRAWSAGRRIGSGGGAGRGGGRYLAGSRPGHARLRPGGHSPGRGGAVRPDAARTAPGGRARRSDWPRASSSPRRSSWHTC